MKNKRQNTIKEVEVDDLLTIGFIQITEIGQENIYFIDAAGQRYFCKCL